MNPTLRIFLFGFLGSVAVEVVRVVRVYEEGRAFPARYRNRGFWVVRGVLALIGGCLAVAYRVPSDILALHVGASTPIITETFARTPPGENRRGEKISGE